MRYFRFLSLALLAVMSWACSEKQTVTEDTFDPSTAKEVVLVPSSLVFVANGEDKLTFRLLADGHDITEVATIYRVVGKGQYEPLEPKEGETEVYFTTESKGVYKFWASAKGVVVDIQEVDVEAIDLEIPAAPADPEPNKVSFVHRTLITEFTGTLCPACPYMLEAMRIVSADDEYKHKFVAGACHNYSRQCAIYTERSAVSDHYGVKYWPTLIVGNRYPSNSQNVSAFVNWIKKAIDDCLEYDCEAGLAVNSTVVNNTAVVKVQLKAVEANTFYVGCWLVEDNIVSPQAGAGPFENLPDPMIHNGAIRYEANYPYYQGEPIQPSPVAGATADKTFLINFDSSWVKENCRLIVYVCVPDKTSGYVVNNVISAPLGQAVPYEYK